MSKQVRIYPEAQTVPFPSAIIGEPALICKVTANPLVGTLRRKDTNDSLAVKVPQGSCKTLQGIDPNPELQIFYARDLAPVDDHRWIYPRRVVRMPVGSHVPGFGLSTHEAVGVVAGTEGAFAFVDFYRSPFGNSRNNNNPQLGVRRTDLWPDDARDMSRVWNDALNAGVNRTPTCSPEPAPAPESSSATPSGCADDNSATNFSGAPEINLGDMVLLRAGTPVRRITNEHPPRVIVGVPAVGKDTVARVAHIESHGPNKYARVRQCNSDAHHAGFRGYGYWFQDLSVVRRAHNLVDVTAKELGDGYRLLTEDEVAESPEYLRGVAEVFQRGRTWAPRFMPGQPFSRRARAYRVAFAKLSTAEPTTTPVAEPTTKPVAEPTTKPVAEPTTKPVAEPDTELVWRIGDLVRVNANASALSSRPVPPGEYVVVEVDDRAVDSFPIRVWTSDGLRWVHAKSAEKVTERVAVQTVTKPSDAPCVRSERGDAVLAPDGNVYRVGDYVVVNKDTRALTEYAISAGTYEVRAVDLNSWHGSTIAVGSLRWLPDGSYSPAPKVRELRAGDLVRHRTGSKPSRVGIITTVYNDGSMSAMFPGASQPLPFLPRHLEHAAEIGDTVADTEGTHLGKVTAIHATAETSGGPAESTPLTKLVVLAKGR